MKNFLKQILGQSKTDRKVMAIEELATKRGTTGGLVKRIDENRELLELLQERVPEFVSSHPWLVGWIKANDNFFTQLEGIIETHQAQWMPKDYPRPWPGMDRAQQIDQLDHRSVARVAGQTVSENKPQRTQRKSLDFEGNEHLKSLVEAMQGTGLFEVFRVSQGNPNLINSQAPIISFWADAESARALSNLLIDELGRSNIPGSLWCLDVGFPRVLPHHVVCHLRCCKFDEDAKSFWKSVWRFILKRQEVDRDFSALREFVVLNFQKWKQEEHRKKESSDQHD